MQGNDISNGVPPCVLVHVSAVYKRTPHFERVLRVLPITSMTYDVDMAMLNVVNRWRDKGVVFEMFHYSDDGWPGDRLFDDLDQYHHPFNRVREFRDTQNLSDYLAYNPYIHSVLDPLHPMRFGSKSLGDF